MKRKRRKKKTTRARSGCLLAVHGSRSMHLSIYSLICTRTQHHIHIDMTSIQAVQRSVDTQILLASVVRILYKLQAAHNQSHDGPTAMRNRHHPPPCLLLALTQLVHGTYTRTHSASSISYAVVVRFRFPGSLIVAHALLTYIAWTSWWGL